MERRAAAVGPIEMHEGVLRENTVGEREELQNELDLVRKHSSISLKRFRDIESVFKRGAFALVGAASESGPSCWGPCFAHILGGFCRFAQNPLRHFC
jgi:hypothetical protein